jgi:hypothetical protein
MPTAIKKSNEEIWTLLFYTKVKRWGKLNEVQKRIYEQTARAGIEDAQRELFGN